MITAADEEAYEVATMTADKHVESQVRLLDAGIEATTWSITDTDHIANQL